MASLPKSTRYYTPCYYSRQNIHLPGGAIDAQALTGAETAHDLRQAGHRGKAELTGHDGAMRKYAAGFHYYALGQDKERYPGRIGGRADQDKWFRREIGRGLLEDQGASLGNAGG